MKALMTCFVTLGLLLPLAARAGAEPSDYKDCERAFLENRYLGGTDFAPLYRGLVKLDGTTQQIQYFGNDGRVYEMDVQSGQCARPREARTRTDILSENVAQAVKRFRSAFSGPKETRIENGSGLLDTGSRRQVNWTQEQYDSAKSKLAEGLRACVELLGEVAEAQLRDLLGTGAGSHGAGGESASKPETPVHGAQTP